MANLVSNQYMQTLLKRVYINGMANAKDQQSPIISRIKKDTFKGKEMNYAVQYSNGGNFGANYDKLLSNKDAGVRNAEWSMTPGYATGFFEISQPEILQTDSDVGSYMKAIANKMSGCFDGLSKVLAIFLYGGKYAVIEKVKEVVTLPTGTGDILLTLPVTSSAAVKLDLGMRVQIASSGEANTSVPSSAFLNSGKTLEVVENNDDSVVLKGDVSWSGLTIPAGSYIELAYVRSANNTTSNGIEGLPELIPSLDDRTGDNWKTYISTEFRGIDRSKATNRFAGTFVKAESTGNHPMTDALMQLLRKTKKKGGGQNNVLIINDVDFEKVQKEADLTRNFISSTDTKKKDKYANFGLSDFTVVFGEAGFNEVIIDPFCPEGTAYSIDLNDLTFYDLGNVGRVLSPVANGQIGKYDIESVGDEGMGNDPKVSLNTDKLFTVTQGERNEFGPVFVIAANVFGAYRIEKTATTGVVHF